LKAMPFPLHCVTHHPLTAQEQEQQGSERDAQMGLAGHRVLVKRLQRVTGMTIGLNVEQQDVQARQQHTVLRSALTAGREQGVCVLMQVKAVTMLFEAVLSDRNRLPRASGESGALRRCS
jgi:hypothetical protein